MISKIIHYCWFGGNPLPESAVRCKESWKKHCPDYEIVEWNESNFDITSCPLYVQQAYTEEKWAFVTDYVRLKVVYEYGGIYLDTDVELLQSPSRLLEYSAYFGFENCGGIHVNTGIGFGAEVSNPIIKEMMDTYDHVPFILENGKYDLTPCPQRNTPVLITHGLHCNNQRQILPGNVLVLPSDYMCPLDYYSGVLHKTSNTISIHWFVASWQTDEQKKKHQLDVKKIRSDNTKHFIITLPNRMLRRILGCKRYESLKNKIKRG